MSLRLLGDEAGLCPAVYFGTKQSYVLPFGGRVADSGSGLSWGANFAGSVVSRRAERESA
jgi:hypothetical protein